MADPGEPHDGDEGVGRWQRVVRLGADQREDKEAADRQRGDQLGHRRELQPIVEHADDEHRQRGERPPAPTCSADRSASGRRTTNDETGEGGDGDGDAAHRRRRRAVPAVGPRRYHGTGGWGGIADECAEQDRGDRGDDEAEDRDKQRGGVSHESGRDEFRRPRSLSRKHERPATENSVADRVESRVSRQAAAAAASRASAGRSG